MARYWFGVFVAGILLALAFQTAEAQASSLRIRQVHVLGHGVRICSWNPAGRRMRVLVRYSHHKHTLRNWYGRTPRRLCALNGGTYNTTTLAPSGNLWAHGRRIRYNKPDAPAVGFVHGRVYMGYKNARRHGAVNIMNGLAYLVRKGKLLLHKSQAPWTTRAQFSCGPRGSDGWYGCFRSAVVKFRSGRVGMVEIALAGMPTAARILHRLHVTDAITFDSGGAAEIATKGRRDFGATVGTVWHRLLPDCMTLSSVRR